SMPGLRRRAFWFVAGGPLASLFCTLACAALYLWTPDWPALRILILLHLAMHAMTVVLTLVPAKKLPGGTIPTDGWNLLSLIIGRPTTLAHWASHVVVHTLRAGRPIGEALDGPTLRSWARWEPPCGYLHFLLLLHSVGHDDLDSARGLIGQALGKPVK